MQYYCSNCSFTQFCMIAPSRCRLCGEFNTMVPGRPPNPGYSIAGGLLINNTTNQATEFSPPVQPNSFFQSGSGHHQNQYDFEVRNALHIVGAVIVDTVKKCCYYVDSIPDDAPYSYAMLIMQYLNRCKLYKKSLFKVYYDKNNTTELNVIKLFDCHKQHEGNLNEFVENFDGEKKKIAFYTESRYIYREFYITDLPEINIDISREEKIFDKDGENFHTIHRVYMMLAFYYARYPRESSELKGHRIGAVLVSPRGEVLAAGFNTVNADKTRHAEVNILQAYYSMTRNSPPPRGSRIYTSLQCCSMCASIIRKTFGNNIKVYYGQADPGASHMDRHILRESEYAFEAKPSSMLKPVRGYTSSEVDAPPTVNDIFPQMAKSFGESKDQYKSKFLNQLDKNSKPKNVSFYLTKSFLNPQQGPASGLFSQVMFGLERKAIKHFSSDAHNPNVRKILFHMQSLLPREWQDELNILRIRGGAMWASNGHNEEIGGIASDGHCLFRSVAFLAAGSKANVAVFNFRRIVKEAIDTDIRVRSIYGEMALNISKRIENLTNIDKNIVWGGQEEIQILSYKLERKINVVCVDKRLIFDGLTGLPMCDANRNRVNLPDISIYFNDNHFGISCWW